MVFWTRSGSWAFLSNGAEPVYDPWLCANKQGYSQIEISAKRFADKPETTSTVRLQHCTRTAYGLSV